MSAVGKGRLTSWRTNFDPRLHDKTFEVGAQLLVVCGQEPRGWEKVIVLLDADEDSALSMALRDLERARADIRTLEERLARNAVYYPLAAGAGETAAERWITLPAQEREMVLRFLATGRKEGCGDWSGLLRLAADALREVTP